jgi:carboxypeptidase D
MAFLNNPVFSLALASVLAITFAAPSPNPGILDLFYNSAEKQYRVSSLPSVNFRVPNSWAGLHPVGADHGSDSLFFWLWQADSIIPSRDLIIWFQGGPACSSLLGLFKEHGPVIFPSAETKPKENEFAWTRAANVLYMDQPIGTGFSNGSTTDSTNNDANTAVAVAWLDNFFKTFPLLKYARIHLAGESYAGVFVSTLFSILNWRSH